MDQSLVEMCVKRSLQQETEDGRLLFNQHLTGGLSVVSDTADHVMMLEKGLCNLVVHLDFQQVHAQREEMVKSWLGITRVVISIGLCVFKYLF